MSTQLARILQSEYKGNSLTFLNEAIDLVLASSKEWNSPELLWESLVAFRSIKESFNPQRDEITLPAPPKASESQQITKTPISNPPLQTSSSTTSISQRQDLKSSKLKKSKKKRHSKVPPWLLHSTSVDIENENLCHVHNLRNLSYDEWMNLDTMEQPSVTCLISRTYDITKLKEIWMGFSPTHSWITFCFFPINKPSPSEKFSQVDEFFRKTDPYDYLCLSIEHRCPNGKMKSRKSAKTNQIYALCTEYDVINMLRTMNDYPFPIQIFPILEPAHTDEEREQRKIRARALLLRVFERTNQVSKDPVRFKRQFSSNMGNFLELGKEFGVESSWFKTFAMFPKKHTLSLQRILWDTGMIRTDIQSLSAASVTFNILPILNAPGVLDLDSDELPRVLHANLRDNQSRAT